MTTVRSVGLGLFILTAVAAGSFSVDARSPGILAVILAVAVGIFGVPHGALDPLVAVRKGLVNGWRQIAVFHLAYVAVAGLAGLLWWLFPAMSLVAFLIVSAWHFGNDWRADMPAILAVAAGVSLLALPLAASPETVEPILRVLAGSDGARLSQGLAALFWPIVGLAGLCGLAALRYSGRSFVELAVLYTAATVMHPLVWFVAYFCWCHSLRHLTAEYRELPAAVAKYALPVTLIETALTVGVALVAFRLSSANAGIGADVHLLRIVFIGLFCLTIPHMIVVAWPDRNDRRYPPPMGP